MLQTHPIDLLCDGLSDVVHGLGRASVGLAVGLSLIAALWVAILHPAGAGPLVFPPSSPKSELAASVITVSHLSKPAKPDATPGPGSNPTVSVAIPPAPLSVCRIEIDTMRPDPLAAGCTPAPAPPPPVIY